MHTTRDVAFFSGPRLRLAGRLYLPDPARDRRAAIVFCHGFGGVKEGTPVGLCTRLADEGFTMFSFDYRGFGASEGERALLLPQEQVEDAVAALEFVATQVPGVDPARIGLYGTSFGGGIAALAAARSPRPCALMVSVPVLSGSQWMQSVHRWYEFRELRQRALAAIAHKAATGEVALCERLDIMAPEPQSLVRYAEKTPISLETVWHLLHHEPMEQAHRIRVPVFLFGADDDTVVPCDQTRQFFERVNTEKQMEIFPSGNHWVVYDEGLPRVAEMARAWFTRHMGLAA